MARPSGGARTRLSHGRENPVAIVRVPRERMVGSGIAIVVVPRSGTSGRGRCSTWCRRCGRRWGRAVRPARMSCPGGCTSGWISEIVGGLLGGGAIGHIGADARVDGGGQPSQGVCVSQPRWTIPHPVPGSACVKFARWDRSCTRMTSGGGCPRAWQEFFPRGRTGRGAAGVLPAAAGADARSSCASWPGPPARRRCEGWLCGRRWRTAEREPEALRREYLRWRRHPRAMYALRPALAFAVLGQARASG